MCNPSVPHLKPATTGPEESWWDIRWRAIENCIVSLNKIRCMKASFHRMWLNTTPHTMYKFCQFEKSSPINKTFQAGRLPNKTVFWRWHGVLGTKLCFSLTGWIKHTHISILAMNSLHTIFTMHIASYKKKIALQCCSVCQARQSITCGYSATRKKKKTFCSHTVHTRVEIGLLKIN